jgi:POT family proton-dependent oligopeptide transporter
VGRGAAASRGAGGFFGHPRGLATLFFTEMWERFSYYGMRALLVLFMTAPATQANAGLGFEIGEATAIYGLYTSLVYLAALPGGWVADNLWGPRRAVFVGGCIIAAGHFSLALPTQPTFFLGLGLVVLGTGLLKPSVSAMVGDLYPEGGARRDAGFSIFYMGINLGAFLGPLVCGFFGERTDWHWGFSLAGVGMLLGLAQYRLGARHLGGAGLLGAAAAAAVARKARGFYRALGGAIACTALLASVAAMDALAVSLQDLAAWLAYAIVALVPLYFAYLIAAGGHTPLERKRLAVIFWLFLLAALFWSGFEQAGSSLNLFAERLTDRRVFGWEAPASWLQSVNPILIILLAPAFGWLWTWLAARGLHPSVPLQFALGLLALSAGFFVIAWGAAGAAPEAPVSPSWLVTTYFLHTVGELCLSPVGLSSITKLAPRERVGQMMGVWFIAASLGNLFAGLLAGRLESLAPAALFAQVASLAGLAGLVALLVGFRIGRLTGDPR